MDAAVRAIDVAESAYDLGVEASEWLPRLVESGRELFDLGSGNIAMLGGGLRHDQQATVSQVVTSDGKPDLAIALMTAVQEIGPEVIRTHTAGALQSEVIEQLSSRRESEPRVYEIYTRHLGCKDVVSVHAHDPDGHGALISMPAAEVAELSPAEKRTWERLAVHIATAYRMRRRLGAAVVSAGYTAGDLPLDAEALLDPASFSVKEAVGDAQTEKTAATIREAALRVDRARGKLRREDPDEALHLWKAMVRGRWSIVDWFDSDGRRFVLAKPNAPELGDPRGLTEREHQVVTYVSHGESSKLISYRLGITKQRVSKLLRNGMHKLGVKTTAQLVEKLRGFPSA
jgi:DNA-binding CsgD family transcriptional regulator